jgi:hypothetical protein
MKYVFAFFFLILLFILLATFVIKFWLSTNHELLHIISV